MAIQISTSGYNMCKASIQDVLTVDTISMAGAQAPYIFQLQVTLEDGEMYVTPAITNLT